MSAFWIPLPIQCVSVCDFMLRPLTTVDSLHFFNEQYTVILHFCTPYWTNWAIKCFSFSLPIEQGLPLHIQIDTFEDPRDMSVFHRGYCQIKVFCDKVSLVYTSIQSTQSTTVIYSRIRSINYTNGLIGNRFLDGFRLFGVMLPCHLYF